MGILGLLSFILVSTVPLSFVLILTFIERERMLFIRLTRVLLANLVLP